MRSLSEISVRTTQNSSRESGASMANVSRRSRASATPASRATRKSLPGSAKRKASGASGGWGTDATKRSRMSARSEWNGFSRAKPHAARASVPPGFSTRSISRMPATGEEKNMTPKRLTTASKEPAPNGSSSAGAARKLALRRPRRSDSRRAASIMAGTTSTPTTLPPGPTIVAMESAGSPGPVATSRTVLPSAMDASCTSAAATGANMRSITARCFSQ